MYNVFTGGRERIYNIGGFQKVTSMIQDMVLMISGDLAKWYFMRTSDWKAKARLTFLGTAN